MLFAALDKPAPRYGHHSLILAPDGSKLSKRHGSTSIGDFRGLGYLPAAMVNYLALLSWHPADEREKFTLAELVEEFDMGRVSKSPAIFDLQKLNWLNGLYIRELSPLELRDLIAPYLAEAGIEFARCNGRWWPRRCRPTWWCWATPRVTRLCSPSRWILPPAPMPTACGLLGATQCSSWPGRS